MNSSTAFRRSIHVEGVSHGSAPIPMGARVGNVVYSSGIAGVDAATSKLALGAAAQVRHAFRNLRSFLNNADASLDEVVRLTFYIKDNAVRAHINEEWLACFPDPDSRPARHILVYDLANGMELQLEAVAVVANSKSCVQPGDIPVVQMSEGQSHGY